MWTIGGFRSVGKLGPDVILLESAGLPSLIGLLVRYVYKIPLICRLKGDIWRELHDEIKNGLPHRKQILRYLNNTAGIFFLSRVDGILPISRHIERRIEAELSAYKPTRVVHIPYSAREDNQQAAEPIPVRGRYILTVTNFNFWGKVQPLLDVVLAVAPHLKKEGLSWIILGDGFFWKRFKGRIGNDLQAECVHLPGKCATSGFYQKALALVYISGMDGLPNVFLEASAARLPIIMNRDSPAHEFIEDGVNGILFEKMDIDGLVKIIKSLDADDAFRRKLGTNAYEYVREHYSVEKISADLFHALQDMLSEFNKSKKG
jgi:glycosyltransferase involved in cell wall biosynthesis